MDNNIFMKLTRALTNSNVTELWVGDNSLSDECLVDFRPGKLKRIDLSNNLFTHLCLEILFRDTADLTNILLDRNNGWLPFLPLIPYNSILQELSLIDTLPPCVCLKIEQELEIRNSTRTSILILLCSVAILPIDLLMLLGTQFL
jgi:hypothetical protein